MPCAVSHFILRYVEMLEQQQAQLVAGVRSMYKKLLNGETWPGSPLLESSEGFPLTHDVLERLEVLHMTGENPVGSEDFEDDFNKIQQRLIDGGASYVARRSSPSTDSEPDLAHADSPRSNSQTSRSSVSQRSRKRSSPATPPPPPPEELSITSKRKRYQGMSILQSMEIEPTFYSEPMVMASPDFSEPSMDFTLYPNTFDSNNGSLEMYNGLGLDLSNLQNNTMTGLPVDIWTQDPEFDSFMRSGYHGPMP
jgi:hypothetical protein